ncbi:hypothetical protein DPMN_096485 [Dreissena polymorpha]|uniref:Uncharacterized protein n=1 Tax=Dreissena polymorpha TaxID=45954 RepID=A0A9D4LB64_DREPO|nr:hypothetical protein DPMN_096485 [Dreissena polymorpha]
MSNFSQHVGFPGVVKISVMTASRRQDGERYDAQCDPEEAPVLKVRQDVCILSMVARSVVIRKSYGVAVNFYKEDQEQRDQKTKEQKEEEHKQQEVEDQQEKEEQEEEKQEKEEDQE